MVVLLTGIANQKITENWVLDKTRTKLNDICFTGLLIFCAVAEPQNSGKSTKSHEIHKNMKNTVKFSTNLIKYMSVQHI